MNIIIQAALHYASRGWRVFPLHGIRDGKCTCGRACESPGKHPRVKGGFKAATVAPSQIEEWWAKWPDANIGIATGRVSGLIVYDIDGARGLEQLDFVQRELGELLKPTLVAQTGKGYHLYYRLIIESGEPVACSSGDGLDVRADGGYVVAPPSRHANGGFYRWLGLGVLGSVA